MNRVIHCGRTVARRLLPKGEVCLTSEMDLEVKSVGGSSVQYSVVGDESLISGILLKYKSRVECN